MESSVITLSTITRNLVPALDLLADMIENPSFAEQELERLKLNRLSELEDRGQDAGKIAEDVMPRLLYHPDHPYGRPSLGTALSVKAIRREDAIGFCRRNYVPGNAALVVVGDVRLEAIKSAIESRFEKWPPGPIPPRPKLHLIPAPTDARTIYLIDRPGSLQSVIAAGWTGAAARAPAWHSLDIVRKELAGQVHSELCSKQSCSYGFDSTFPRRNGAAPFVVSGWVHKLDTKAAILEIVKQTAKLAETGPITTEHIKMACDGMIPLWFDRFETMAGIATEAADVFSLGLPERYWVMEPNRYRAVSEVDAHQVAAQYLRRSQMRILVVGDREWIEAPLRSLPFVRRIILLDSQGNPLPGQGSVVTGLASPGREISVPAG